MNSKFGLDFNVSLNFIFLIEYKLVYDIRYLACRARLPLSQVFTYHFPYLLYYNCDNRSLL